MRAVCKRSHCGVVGGDADEQKRRRTGGDERKEKVLDEMRSVCYS